MEEFSTKVDPRCMNIKLVRYDKRYIGHSVSTLVNLINSCPLPCSTI